MHVTKGMALSASLHEIVCPSASRIEVAMGVSHAAGSDRGLTKSPISAAVLNFIKKATSKAVIMLLTAYRVRTRSFTENASTAVRSI